jgi:Family of unknown function (DUF5691)
LPDSALSRRMFERARTLLEFKIDDLDRKTIEVRLPEDLDKAMRRDGVDPTTHDQEITMRTRWLSQILWAIPPARWPQESGWTVNELIEAANQSEWKNVLIGAWTTSATQSRDEEWAYALLVDSIDNDSLLGRRLPNYYRDELFAVLPTARQESLAIEELSAYLSQHTAETPLERKEPLTIEECLGARPYELPRSFINYCTRPWSEALSRLAIDWMLPQMVLWSESRGRTHFESHAPYLLNPAVIPETISRITEATNPPGQRAPDVERFLNIIQARYETLSAFEALKK